MKTAWLGPEFQVSMCPRPHLWFWAHITASLTQKNKRLYWFQPSPVVLCMQNSDFRIRITSLCGSRHDLSFCTCTTAWLAPELLGSLGSSPHLWFCAFKTATLWPQLLVSMGPRPHLWFSAFKTACLASELLVSMDPSPHLWFLHTKQRLLDPNSKSLCVPDITYSFVPPMQCD